MHTTAALYTAAENTPWQDILARHLEEALTGSERERTLDAISYCEQLPDYIAELLETHAPEYLANSPRVTEPQLQRLRKSPNHQAARDARKHLVKHIIRARNINALGTLDDLRKHLADALTGNGQSEPFPTIDTDTWMSALERLTYDDHQVDDDVLLYMAPLLYECKNARHKLHGLATMPPDIKIRLAVMLICLQVGWDGDSGTREAVHLHLEAWADDVDKLARKIIARRTSANLYHNNQSVVAAAAHLTRDADLLAVINQHAEHPPSYPTGRGAPAGIYATLSTDLGLALNPHTPSNAVADSIRRMSQHPLSTTSAARLHLAGQMRPQARAVLLENEPDAPDEDTLTELLNDPATSNDAWDDYKGRATVEQIIDYSRTAGSLRNAELLRVINGRAQAEHLTELPWPVVAQIALDGEEPATAAARQLISKEILPHLARAPYLQPALTSTTTDLTIRQLADTFDTFDDTLTTPCKAAPDAPAATSVQLPSAARREAQPGSSITR